MGNEKKGWPELGLITKNAVKDKDGNVVKNKKGEVVYRLGFKIADDITILRNGKPVALNEFRTGLLKTPLQEVEELYKNGAIGDDQIESRRESANSNQWLRYKVVLPPPRD